MANTLTLHFPTIAALNTSLALNSGSYEIAITSDTGAMWTPGNAPQNPIFSGGPPFADMPMLIGSYADVVTEVIPLQIRGADHNTVVSNIRALKRALSTASLIRPAILQFKADLATNSTYFEVYAGTLQEGPEFVNLPAPNTLIARCTLTLTRRAYGTAATATSIFSSQTFTNNPTAGSPNYRQMTVANGDLIYSGQPMSIEVTAASADFTSSGIKIVYMATLTQAPASTAPATAISTSSTSGINVGSAWSTTWNGTGVGIGTKQRIVARVGATVANLEMRAVVTFAVASGTGTSLYESEWIAVPSGAYSTQGTYVDFGGFRLSDSQQLLYSASTVNVQLQARATTGTATGTLRRIERLSYVTWMRMESAAALTTDGTPRVYTAYDTLGTEQAVRLFQTPWAFFGSIAEYATPRGTAPTAISSGYLYFAWMNANLQTEAATFTADVAYAPMYFSHRGGA